MSTTAAVLIAWLFLPAVYADEARLTRLPKTEQFQWTKEIYPVNDGKILIEGVYYREGWLISIENVAAEFKPAERRYNWEGRPFEVRIPIKSGPSKIKVKEIGPHGELKEHWIDVAADGTAPAAVEPEPPPGPPSHFRFRLEVGLEARDSSEKFNNAKTNTVGVWGLPKGLFEASWRRNLDEDANDTEYTFLGGATRIQRADAIHLPFDWVAGLRALWKRRVLSPLAQIRYENLSTATPDYTAPSVYGSSDLTYKSRRIRNFWMDFGVRNIVQPGPHEFSVTGMVSLAPYSRSSAGNASTNRNGVGLGFGGEGSYRLSPRLYAVVRLGVFLTRGSEVDLNFFRASTGLAVTF